MNNTYWNHNGKFQREYEILEKLLLSNPDGPDCAEGKLLNNLSGFYSRRYNDGDLTSSYASPFNKGAKAMERYGLPHLVLTRHTNEARLETIVDAVVEFLYKRLVKKQITVVVQVAITMEVPVDMDTDAIKDMVKFNTVWDVTSEYPNADMVDVSDILAINSITEAKID